MVTAVTGTHDATHTADRVAWLAPRHDRRTLALLVGAPLAAVALAAWDPDRTGGPPLCPLRACTGIACPGCGLTRATGALLRGRVGDALHIHPFALALVAQVALLWVLACTAAGRRVLSRTPASLTVVVLVANAVALLVLWGTRLSTGWIDVVS